MNKKLWFSLLITGTSLILLSLPGYNPTSTNSDAGQTLRVSPIGEMTTDRATHQATILENGEVFITGGCAGRGCERILSSAEVFNPDSGSFRSVSPMNTPRAGHTAVRLPNGHILVAGGWTGIRATRSAEIYNPETDKWNMTGRMSHARASLISVSLPDSSVLIMGGGSGRLGDLTTIELFNPASGMFTAAGKSVVNHYLATATSNGQVLMSGGQDKEGNIHGMITTYTPETGKTEQAGVMEVPRVKHAAARLPDGRILIIGGSGSEGYSQRYSTTEIFDPKNGTLSNGPSLRYARHKIRDAVVVLPSGKIVVAGGAIRPEVFDPVNQVFRTLEGQLSGPQMFATATLLHNENILVLGGYDDRTRTSNTAWLIHSGNQ